MHHGHDHRDGHARTAPSRKICRPPGHNGRRKTALHKRKRLAPVDSRHNGDRSMRLRDMTELAVRNLREAILRNSLTTLGVAVGVASLVAMLSLGVGLQTLASQRLNKSGLFDAVFVSSKRGMRFMGGDGPRPTTKKNAPNSEDAKVLDEPSRQDMAKLPNVVEVYPQVRFLAEVRMNGGSYSTNVLGLPDSDRANGTFDGITGKAFSSATADQAILQSEFAKELSPQPASL